jgi:hypothetical protein
MRKLLVLSRIAGAVLLISLLARARPPAQYGYQAATVISVTRQVSISNNAGDNPSDAPLQSRDYSYRIAIRLNCNIYVGRYQSALKYLPSVFVPNHALDVRLHRHILYVSLPFEDEEVMMGIVGHKGLQDEVCAQPAPKTPATASTHSQFTGGQL